jgi:hypothetical protein
MLGIDRKRLADKIAADILKTEPRKRSYPTCSTCGREFTPKSDVAGRFCSQRCVDLHDIGYTPQPNPESVATRLHAKADAIGPAWIHDQLRELRDYINGLRCCSTECERALAEVRSQGRVASVSELGREWLC